MEEQIKAAAIALKMDRDEFHIRGEHAYYYAQETGEWYRLTEDDLEYAVECAKEYPGDAYSHWCSASGQVISLRRAEKLGLP